MAEVFSGFVCGFTLSIMATPPFALWVLKSRDDISFIRNAVPPGMPLTLLSVPIASFFFLGWTALGLIFGMVLIAANDAHPQGGLGTPNLLFTAIVTITAFVIFFPFFALVRSARRLAIFLAFTFVALFGWATPILAHYASTRAT
ncbi:MAG TPA: hypothetical protein VM013_06255 [Dehalococcoidia bacterium]|nr:hypothetical protein [Dehalococcoidia bacterium]